MDAYVSLTRLTKMTAKERIDEYRDVSLEKDIDSDPRAASTGGTRGPPALAEDTPGFDHGN